ncbi:putative membrane protein [Brevibacillus aydinogluensis]|uniref:hypothetical protein n=1 Tax=Brevibacillus aydinogluensis TaxID=927786 RepID=UPI0028933AD7|nr:hypothetical protein [Brevibacillus aydinogluensis]MDT3417187.1 putative membrane protein [Brevibacillus aydinogluensis]
MNGAIRHRKRVLNILLMFVCVGTFLLSMLAGPVEVFAEAKQVEIKVNPDTETLVKTGQTAAERFVGAVQALAGFATVVLMIIGFYLRSTANGNSNKVQSGNSFIGWGLATLVVAFTADRIASFFLGLFS